jgi:hypothetical protein
MSTQPALFGTTAGRQVPPAADPTRGDLHIEHVTVALPGGRALRLARVSGVLILASGFSDDDALRALAGGLVLPLATWPAVRDELDRLASNG